MQVVLFSGRSDGEIAEALGVSPSSIRRLRSFYRKADLVTLPTGGLRNKPRYWWKDPKVQAVLFSGKHYREIAATLGVKPHDVSRLRLQSRRAGIEVEGQM